MALKIFEELKDSVTQGGVAWSVGRDVWWGKNKAKDTKSIQDLSELSMAEFPTKHGLHKDFLNHFRPANSEVATFVGATFC